jgi:PKD domain/Bacterial Ig-like domain (group 3)
MKKILRIRLLLTIISLILVAIPIAALPRANAVFTGEVCILASSTATSCGTTPPNFTPATGTSLTVSFFIQGSDALNGIKMSVKTDNTILNPTAISSVGTVVPPPQITLVDCINGVPVAGSGASCQAGIDGVGVASLGILSLGGATIAPTTGMMFSVTYSVLSNSPAAIDVLAVSGCAGGSVTGTNDCVLISDGAAVVPETALVGATVNGVTDANALATVNNVFGIDPSTTSVACNPNIVSIGKPSTCTATVTDTTAPANTPTGSVSFALSAGTTGGSLSAPSCALATGSCSVTFSGSAPGSASVNATYAGDGTHHGSAAKTLASITVKLDSTTTTVPNITCNIATGGTSCTANVVATVTDLNTTSIVPTGTVTFTLIVGATGGSLSAPNCPLSAGSCSVTFTGTSVGSGSITASYSGDSSHSGSTSSVATITVTKGANFGISASQSSVTMMVGTTSKINVTLTPISGFTGPITLTNSTTPTVGLTLTCNPKTVSLSATPVNSTCTIGATSAGTYFLTITGTSTSPSLSNSLATPITVTVSKAGPIITTQLVNATNNQPLGPNNGAVIVTVGTRIYDTAAIIGDFFATGSVNYNLFNNRDCTGSTFFPTRVTISNHIIPNYPATPFNTAGFNSFNVTYAGDGNNTATSSTCEPLTVNAPPVPSFAVTNQPVYQTQGTGYYLQGTALSFNASSSHDPDASVLSDSIVLAIWNFGDGSGPIIQPIKLLANHTYTTVGSFTVTLTVTDQYDGTNSTSSTVIIVVPQVKIVSYHLSSTSSTIGDRVTLTIDILNNGLLPLTFNVTMTVASLTAGTAQTVDQQQVTLAPNQENSAITLHWDTAGFSAQSYTIVIKLVNARANGTPVSLLTSSQGAGSVTLSPQGSSQLPGGNTLWITIGIVAAVAIILGLTAILLRRRKIPTS